jgi:DNA-binding CsgD family transcriptional regulator
MARIRTGSIKESAPILEALARYYRGSEKERPLRMLLAVQHEPGIRNRELAERLNVVERTIRRWWSDYSKWGLRCILELGDDEPLPVFNTFSITAPTHTTERTGDISLRFQRFLNKLPTTTDLRAWIMAFQDGLGMILDGVDRISISVDLGCDIDAPDSRNVAVVMNQMSTREAPEGARAFATSDHHSGTGEIVFEQARRGGFPIEDYHRPHAYDFTLDDGTYVGTLMLWSYRRGPATPQSTLRFVESLRGFFGFLFSDCIVRQLRRDPAMNILKDLIGSIAARIGLTGRQLEVFALDVLGTPRCEIAERLRIKPGTVHKHISSIYQKAGTTNYTELLARFYTPMQDD